MDGQWHGSGGHRFALFLVQAKEKRIGIGAVCGGIEEVAITPRIASPCSLAAP
jgi:hypothetical protein